MGTVQQRLVAVGTDAYGETAVPTWEPGKCGPVGDGGGAGATARIDAIVEDARRLLPPRVGAGDLAKVRARGGLIVDTRPVEQRQRDGELEGALVIDRNVLEWRLDPTSPYRIPQAAGEDQEIVVVCDEGYSSTLAAASLQKLGLTRATDLIGGFQALIREREAFRT